MCGIAGLITSSGKGAIWLSRLEAMTEALRHRGPDDAGIDVIYDADPTVIFGHRRLAIIDLSSAGHQPMCDPHTGNWITFNGEIYNYRELRQDLEKQGQIFHTQ